MGAERMAVLFVAIAILLVAGHAMVFQSFLDSTTRVNISNESFTPTGGTHVILNDSNIDLAYYDAQKDITVRNDSLTFSPNGNWSWRRANGTLFVNATGTLNTTTEAGIDYGYGLANESTNTIFQLQSTLLDNIGPMILLALVAAVGITAVRVLGAV